MTIQKPTVLDAARIAAELQSLKGKQLISVFTSVDGNCFLAGLSNVSQYLIFEIGKQFAMMGLIQTRPNSLIKAVQILQGYLVVSVAQPGKDRIIEMQLEKADRLGRKVNSTIIFELIPNKGNVILIGDNGSIKWSLRRRSSDHYKFPSPLKKPTTLNIMDHVSGLSSFKPGELAENIYGLNPLDIRNLYLEKFDQTSDAILAIAKFVKDIIKPGPAWIIRMGSEPIGYSLVQPTLEDAEDCDRYESALMMYPNYYKNLTDKIANTDHITEMLNILDKEISAQKFKLDTISNAIAKAHDFSALKLRGELILVNIDLIKKGMDTVTLNNFKGHVPDILEIKLDPSKSASANAGDYFAQYKKASASIDIQEKRLESVRKKIEDLEQVRAKHLDDFEALRNELAKRGLIKSSPTKRKAVERRLPYKKYIAANGWEILVGRTSADNDELTFKIASKDDYWFHAWQAAGSHAILRLPDRNAVPDKKTIEEAASLAAFYSKARTAGKVPVAYTQAKFVRKPRNFPPGKVLVEREKQIIVRPADIKKYKNSLE